MTYNWIYGSEFENVTLYFFADIREGSENIHVRV